MKDGFCSFSFVIRIVGLQCQNGIETECVDRVRVCGQTHAFYVICIQTKWATSKI